MIVRAALGLVTRLAWARGSSSNRLVQGCDLGQCDLDWSLISAQLDSRGEKYRGDSEADP